MAIAWVVNTDGVITIPKAFQLKHVESNEADAEIVLSSKEMDLITKSYNK